MTTVRAADLFCGAGGFSSGLINAAAKRGFNVDLVAINHWDIAIQTHSANHADVRHLCQSIESVNPREVVPGGKLDLLMASPECTHFSTARGGKPMSEQSRCTVWCVLRWLEQLDVTAVLIENVPEFITWGPLHPCTCGAQAEGEAAGIDWKKVKHRSGFKCLRPIEKKKGAWFRNFIRNLKALGYKCDWRVLNAADHGGVTSRERFFLMARKDRRQLIWPEPSHQRVTVARTSGQMTLGFGDRKPWRAAREIIDWDLRGHSIYLPPNEAKRYRVKRPLAGKTLERIYAGLRKFGGIPFLLPQQSGGQPREVGQPCPTVASAGAISLIEPFLVMLRAHGSGPEGCACSLDDPLRSLCTGNHIYLAESVIVGTTNSNGNGSYAYPLHEPLRTVTGRSEFGLAQPIIVGSGGPEGHPRSVDEPLRTVLGRNHSALVEFLVSVNHGNDRHSPDARVNSLEDPLPTQTSKRTRGLASGCIIPFHGEREGQESRCSSIDEPLSVVACSRTHGLAEFLVKYHGTGEGAYSLDDPLSAITTKDRLALVHPELIRTGQVDGWVIGWLDILFRMLRPHELAGGMGFARTYSFAGNQEDQVRQIGNAVEVNQAEALCTPILQQLPALA